MDEKGKKRNSYIDFLKGIAAIGIVAIHGILERTIIYSSMVLELDIVFGCSLFLLPFWLGIKL